MAEDNLIEKIKTIEETIKELTQKVKTMERNIENLKKKPGTDAYGHPINPYELRKPKRHHRKFKPSESPYGPFIPDD
jgi:predicted RNase H-like nuclease (RuvC/YqgF family)